MPRLLRRDDRNAMLGGVAAGFAEYFEVDPVIVRLGFVLLALLQGLGVALYAACWLLIPRRDAAAAGAPEAPAEGFVKNVREKGESIVSGMRRAGGAHGGGRVVGGAILILLGGILLLDRMTWWRWPGWARPANLWPLVLIIIGIALVVESVKGKEKGTGG